MSTLIKILRKIAKWTGIFLLVLLSIFFIVILVIRTEWAQSKIVDYATGYLSEKTDTRIDIERLFITFSGNVQLEGLYVEDQKQDTLVYSRSLEAGIGLSSLFSGSIHISEVNWKGLKADIHRGTDSTFNFNFIINAFAGQKDSTAAPAKNETSPTQFSIGPILLSDFDLHYLDSVAGINSTLFLGELSLNTDETDFEQLRFEVDHLRLKNTRADVEQFALPPPAEEDTGSSSLPFISCDDLLLENLDLRYASVDSLLAKAVIGKIRITSSVVNLHDQDISAGSIRFLNNDFRLKLPSPAGSNSEPTTVQQDSSTPFSWPGWQVELEELEFAHNDLQLDRGNSAPPENVFDPDHLGLSDLNIQMSDVSLKEQQAELDLQKLSFTERSGFTLKDMAIDILLDDREADVDKLEFTTGHSRLNSSLHLEYPSLEQFISSPLEHIKASLTFSDTRLSLRDAFYFSDSLRQDSLMRRFAPYPLAIQARIEGSLSDINVKHFHAEWLKQTELTLRGGIRGLPDTSALEVEELDLNLSTVAKDLALIVPPSPGSEYPRQIELQSTLNGNASDLQANLKLMSPMGKAELSTHLSQLSGVPKYEGDLRLTDIKAGKISGNQDLGSVSLQMDFKGEGIKRDVLEVQSDIRFTELIYKKYDYSALDLHLQVRDRMAEARMTHTDQNLDFDLLATAVLDSAQTHADVELDLRGADLHDLHLSSGNLKTALDLHLSFDGQPSSFSSELQLSNATFKQEDEMYRLDSLFARLINEPAKTGLAVESQILEGELRANTSLQKLISSLSTYLKQVVDSSAFRGSPDDSLDMKANFTIANSPVLSEIFLPGLSRMDTVTIDAEYKPSERILYLNMRAPEIVYGESELQGLLVNLGSTGDTIWVDFGFEHLFSDPVEIHSTRFDLNVSERTGSAVLKVLDSEEKEVFYSSAQIERRRNSILIQIDPNHLVLNKNNWNIPSGNSIEIGSALTYFTNFRLSRNNQELSIRSNEETSGITIDFNNFNLAAIFSILNPERSPLSGSLEGELKFVDLDKTPAFTADLQLQNLTLTGNEIGRMSLKANNNEPRTFQVDIDLQGPEIDLSVDGDYSTAGETQNLDMSMDIQKINLSLVQSFIPEQMSNSQGFISGQFDVKGPTADLQYEGQLVFQDASFTPVILGTALHLHKEVIDIDSKAVSFDNFTLTDADDNTTVLDGKIITENMLNPRFDLHLEANQFQLLNSTEEDNELFYGDAIIDVDIDVTGDLNLPVVDARVGLLEGTEITYVIPAAQAQIQERKGIVRFRNMQDTTYSIFYQDENNTTIMKGMDLTAYLDIDPGTKFIVVVDPQSGDRLTVTGEAQLSFDLSPNGNMSLSGAYELSDGAYKLSLYELVKKEFNIVPGSRIEWTGDPMNASLKITAIYKIEASPADLFADQLAGADPGTFNRYQQKIPFEVMLYIRGNLNQPKISFGLDMPENSRSALGGSVYSRIQQLNEDESQLNKQVFSLIVFNKFLPSNVARGTGNGTSELARSSVSKMLSNQLNSLSDKYIEGVELNFDLDSYTDYQSGAAQQRTDLNVSLKKGFFDDRVVVEVGSQVGVEGPQRENSEIVGDVSVEYLLTENGRYRLRAFRKNQYQDLIEGQVIITGLAILFNKEFDTWKELFNKDNRNNKNEGEESAPGNAKDGNEQEREDSSGNNRNDDKAVENKNSSQPEKEE